MVSADPQIWIQAFLTIAATSFVFRDNIVFKVAQYTFIGVAAGHAIVMGVKNIIDYGWVHLAGGAYIYVVVFILGIMLYARFSKEYYWLYRYPIAFMVGNGIGISIRAAIHSDFIKNIAATASPLVASDAMGTFNNIVIFVGVITALSHFIFTYEGMHKGTLGFIPKIGRWMMLMAFGASFGNTVMTRFGMYQGRILFLLRDWLQVV
ncbi:hypothetical protein E3J39_00280 [Candidatus Bathyarchaeota archaeon]|nr:MAG: hypothetical protein E3J39_00280 [Candidatus Bathyarchaeota archaeon]